MSSQEPSPDRRRQFSLAHTVPRDNMAFDPNSYCRRYSIPVTGQYVHGQTRCMVETGTVGNIHTHITSNTIPMAPPQAKQTSETVGGTHVNHVYPGQMDETEQINSTRMFEYNAHPRKMSEDATGADSNPRRKSEDINRYDRRASQDGREGIHSSRNSENYANINATCTGNDVNAANVRNGVTVGNCYRSETTEIEQEKEPITGFSGNINESVSGSFTYTDEQWTENNSRPRKTNESITEGMDGVLGSNMNEYPRKNSGRNTEQYSTAMHPSQTMHTSEKLDQPLVEHFIEPGKANLQDYRQIPHISNVSSTQSITSSTSSLTFDANLSRFLYCLWRRNIMCDILITFNGESFRAHKIALAAHSEKYSGEFFMNVPDGIFEISILNTSKEAIKEVIRFFYTSELRVSCCNVGTILCCAKQLGIFGVTDICKKFLIDCNPEHALYCIPIAKKYNFLDVLATLQKTFCENFYNVIRSNNFLRITVDQIKHIVRSGEFGITEALDSFQGIIVWINFSPKTRVKYAPELLGSVNFLLIPIEELVAAVDKYEYIFQNPTCKEIVIHAFAYHTAKRHNCRLLNNYVPIVNNQHGSQNDSTSSFSKTTNFSFDLEVQASLPTTPSVLAIGGVDPFNPGVDVHCPYVERYDEASNNWKLLTNMPEPLHHTGAAMLDGYLYIIGGSVLISDDAENFNMPTKKCFRYDALTNGWATITPLQQARMYHSVAILEGVLYAVGGHNANSEPLKTAEFYNPDTNKWRYIASMSEAKIGTSAVGHKGLLYVTGGFFESGEDKRVLATVECYDPRTNVWASKTPLPVPSCHANLVVANNDIYHIGGATIADGNTSITSLNSVLRFCEEQEQWEQVHKLGLARHDAGATAIGSNIFIVGGLSSGDNGALSTFECFNVETRLLQNLTPLTHPVLGLVCCTLPEVEHCSENQVDRQ
ncbi:hypothetical protein ScPMuIL_005521 [Solemya velum]